MNGTKKRLERIKGGLPDPKFQACVLYRYADGADEEKAKAAAVKVWETSQGMKLPANVRYIAVRIVGGR